MMTKTDGLIGYETLIEHHRLHHKEEDTLRAKLELAKEALEYIAKSTPLPECDRENIITAQQALQKLEE